MVGRENISRMNQGVAATVVPSRPVSALKSPVGSSRRGGGPAGGELSITAGLKRIVPPIDAGEDAVATGEGDQMTGTATEHQQPSAVAGVQSRTGSFRYRGARQGSRGRWLQKTAFRMLQGGAEHEHENPQSHLAHDKLRSSDALSWIPYISVPAIIVSLVIPNIFLFSSLIFWLTDTSGGENYTIRSQEGIVISSSAVIRLRIYLAVTTFKSMVFPLVCVMSSIMCWFGIVPATGTEKTTRRKQFQVLRFFSGCIVLSCTIRYYVITWVILNPDVWTNGQSRVHQVVYDVAPALVWLSNAVLVIAVSLSLAIAIKTLAPVCSLRVRAEQTRLLASPRELCSLVYQFAAASFVLARFLLAVSINTHFSTSHPPSESCVRIDNKDGKVPILNNLVWAFDSVSLSPCLYAPSSWGPAAFIVVELCLMVLTVWLPRRIAMLSKYHSLRDAYDSKEAYHRYSSHVSNHEMRSYLASN
jgi:hypothetical protein